MMREQKATKLGAGTLHKTIVGKWLDIVKQHFAKWLRYVTYLCSMPEVFGFEKAGG